MTTTSTEALTQQLRTRLLTYQPPAAAATLTARIGGRLYIDWPPDRAVFPYGIMRLMNGDRDGAYNGERMTAEMEVQLYSNTRVNAVALEGMADVCDMAMLKYVDAGSGLVFSRQGRRDTLPPPSDPADREVVTIRLVYPLRVWPLFLHTAATT